jgi:glycosyltransferase involved in cell wall biosynthesis
MPIVLLEAAASSLPAVATDVGESRVIIDPPRGGRVAAARDPHALGRVMLEVQTLPHDERARMVAHAHDRVARMFDLDAIVTRWLQIYERLARRDSSSAHDRMSSAN